MIEAKPAGRSADAGTHAQNLSNCAGRERLPPASSANLELLREVAREPL
jgi:hypothetical protein